MTTKDFKDLFPDSFKELSELERKELFLQSCIRRKKDLESQIMNDVPAFEFNSLLHRCFNIEIKSEIEPILDFELDKYFTSGSEFNFTDAIKKYSKDVHYILLANLLNKFYLLGVTQGELKYRLGLMNDNILFTETEINEMKG